MKEGWGAAHTGCRSLVLPAPRCCLLRPAGCTLQLRVALTICYLPPLLAVAPLRESSPPSPSPSWPAFKVDSAGAPVCEVEMDDPPSAAFYLHWAPCGTRLLLLSAWPSGPVALKAWDVGLALLAAEGGVQLRARKPVLLGAARPLFLTCCPSSTRCEGGEKGCVRGRVVGPHGARRSGSKGWHVHVWFWVSGVGWLPPCNAFLR